MLTLLHGDALTKLAEVESESVQTCVTSPPYWGLRDYGTATWQGGDPECDHVAPQGQRQDTGRGNHNGGKPGFHGGAKTELSVRYYRGLCAKCGAARVDCQLGVEKTPEEYVAALVEIFREVRRVLRNDGTLWLNLGDSYCASAPGNKPDWATSGLHGASTSERYQETLSRSVQTVKDKTFPGLKPKDLVGIPWMVAFALRADGWYLRSDIIWSKPNPMPESVTDRPTKSHEYIFLLSKSGKYYYDAEAIKEPIADSSFQRINQPNFDNQTGGEKDYGNGTNPNRSARKALENFAGRERGRPNGAATFENFGHNTSCGTPQNGLRNKRSVWEISTFPFPEAHFATFPTEIPTICTLAGSKPGDVVLDPFAGSGTTGKVAIELGRKAILIEPKAEYVEMIERRCKTTIGLPLTA